VAENLWGLRATANQRIGLRTRTENEYGRQQRCEGADGSAFCRSYNDFLSDGGKLMVNPLTAWARNGEVEIDSAVYHAHTWSCCYLDSAAGGSLVTLNHDEAVQEEGYHGEGAQVR